MHIKNFVDLYKLDKYKISLFYIHPSSQTDEVCLAAVKRRPDDLYHVVNQIDEICKEAVRRDGKALAYVKNKTIELAWLAIESEPYLGLQYTPKHLQSYELCLEAAKKDKWALEAIENSDLRLLISEKCYPTNNE